MPNYEQVPGKPGWLRDKDTGDVIDVSIDREDDVWDTEALASGNIPLNKKLDLFATTKNKDKLDSNASSEKRAVGTSEKLTLERIGVYIPATLGNSEALPSDIKKVAESGYLYLKLSRVVVAEGPGTKFPSGYGLTGNSFENQQGVVGIGSPATAAQAKLSKTFNVRGETEVEARYEFQQRTAFVAANLTGGLTAGAGTETPNISVPVAVRLYLHGKISQAGTPG